MFGEIPGSLPTREITLESFRSRRITYVITQLSGSSTGRAKFSSVDPSSRTQAVDRALVACAILIPVLYALIVNLSMLDAPPAWDSATTVSAAALTLVDLDFDIVELARMPGMLDGGPSTHATSAYTILLALLVGAFGPENGFFVGHVLSIVLVGGLTGSTYLLGRERLTVRHSALVALVVGLIPLVVQQAADLYLDLPLAIVTTLACWAAARRRFWLTVAMAFVGVTLKTSAVFLLPLILLARPAGRSMQRHLAYSAAGGFVAALPFLPAFLTTERFDRAMTLDGQIQLLQSSLNLFILTVDLAAITFVFILVMYGRARSGSFDRLARIVGVLVVSFLGVHIATVVLTGTIAVLPRYYISIIPAMLVTMLPSGQTTTAGARRRRVGLAFLMAILIFSIVNVRGDFYPFPDHEFYVVAERSTRAQDLLAMQIEGTRRLADTGLPIFVGLPEYFRIAYPDLGYVESTPFDYISLFDGWPTVLPDEFAVLIERRYANPLLTIEERAIAEGYQLEYQTIQRNGYESELIVATRP